MLFVIYSETQASSTRRIIGYMCKESISVSIVSISRFLVTIKKYQFKERTHDDNSIFSFYVCMCENKTYVNKVKFNTNPEVFRVIQTFTPYRKLLKELIY